MIDNQVGAVSETAPVNNNSHSYYTQVVGEAAADGSQEPCNIAANCPIAAKYSLVADQLKQLRQWLPFKFKERPGKERPTKVPYDPQTGYPAHWQNAEIWLTLEQVCAFVRDNPGYDGIGIVLTADDPFTVVDLDNAIDPETGELKPAARQIVERLNSYTEISPSKTGVHVIIEGKPPQDGHDGFYQDQKVEIYFQNHFITITGDRWPGRCSK
jgi:putative DNA primase/helicase